MKLVAVIPTFNRAELVVKSVKALLAASRPPDFIVVIDNASADNTVALLERMFHTDKRVLTLRSDENTGAAAGFAWGIEVALEQGADWVWLVDDDAEVAPDALEVLEREVSTRDHSCVASIMVGPDRETLSWGALVCKRDNKGTGLARHWQVKTLGKLPIRASYAPYTGMLLPRTAIEEVGLPRKDFFMWADDVEYSFRLTDAGWSIDFVPQSHIIHAVQERRHFKVGPASFSVLIAPPWKRYYAVRNEIRMNLERRDFRRLARQLSAAWIAAALESDRRHAWPYYLRGLRDGVLGRMGPLSRPEQ